MEKLLAIVFLVFIIGSLFLALRHMLTQPQSDGRMVRALGWRVGLSIALIGILSLGHWLGYWSFHGAGT